MGRTGRRLLLGLGFFFLAGCTAKIPYVIVSDYDNRKARLIAVMPVSGGSVDQQSARMLRAKLLEELYFKGYPKVPLTVIDAKLATLPFGNGEKPEPKMVGALLNVDAVLYPTLMEGGLGQGVFYAATGVGIECELRCAKTGESLWRVQHRVVRRNVGFSRKQLELKSSRVYETTLQEVVNRVLETLPDGPESVGS